MSGWAPPEHREAMKRRQLKQEAEAISAIREALQVAEEMNGSDGPQREAERFLMRLYQLGFCVKRVVAR